MAKIIDNYILLETMGEARLGEIQKGRNLISKDNVAVLTIKLDKFLNQNDMRDQIINEIQTLKKLQKNQNIMQMIKMLKSSNNIYLVYEFLEGHSLKQFVQEQLNIDHKLSEQECLDIFYQVLKAFQQINKEGIIKKNLNTSNIYLNKGIVKLKNFFYCKNGNGEDSQQKNLKDFQILHHLEFAAPEILFYKEDQNQQQQYDETCDIFSLGLVMFYLLTNGNLPVQFQNQSQFTLQNLQSIYTQINPQQSILDDEQNINMLQNFGISKNLQLILQKMLEVNKEKRINWEDLQQFSHTLKTNSTPKSKQYSLTTSSNSNKNLLNNNINNNSSHQLQNSMRNSVKKKPSLTENFGRSVNSNSSNNNNQNFQRNSKEFSQSLRSNRLNTNGNISSNQNERILQNNNSINSNLNTNGSCSDLKQLENNSTTSSNSKLKNYGFNQSYKSPTSGSNNKQNNSSFAKNLNNTSLLQIQFQQKFQKFQDNIMQERSKIVIIMSAIQKCLNHIKSENQNLQIAVIYLLLKKGLFIQKSINQNFKNQYQQFYTDKENNIHSLNTNKNNNEILSQIQHILQQELREIVIKFQMFTSEFLVNLDLNQFSNNLKIVKQTLQAELQNLDEIENLQKLDFSLIQISKALVNNNPDQDKNVVLTSHYITDIGNIENVYQKFLGKKRIDILNHPYFKKLNDIQIEKLQDNLNNKFKLYEYQQQQQLQQISQQQQQQSVNI